MPEKPFFNPEERKLIRSLFCADLTDIEAEHFTIICERLGLDPYTKQIYARSQNVNRGSRQQPKWEKALVVITGIDGFRSLAEKTGEYRGQTIPQWCGADGTWRDVWLDEALPPVAARVGVFREGFKEPLFAVARYASYVQYTKSENPQPTAFWTRMADSQLLKCAEAQALRKAFPVVLGAINIEEELGDAPDKLDPALIEKQEADRAKAHGGTAEGAKNAFPEAKKPEATATQATTPKPEAAKQPENKAQEPQGSQEPTQEEKTPPAASQSEFKPFSKREASELPESEQWRAHQIHQVKVASFLGRRLDDFTMDELERMKESWVEKFREKREAEGNEEKIKEAAIIMKAFNYRLDQATGGRPSDVELEKLAQEQAEDTSVQDAAASKEKKTRTRSKK